MFELSIGKRILRKDFQKSRGNIPVYSANVFTPFVFSDVSNITDFQSSYVIWGIDGKFEFNVVGMGKPFATTDHCGLIKILNSNVDPYFLAYMLRETSHIYGFDRGLRASLTNMKNVKITIPITNSGVFDIEYQRFIARQLESVEQVKREIKQKQEHISNISFDIDMSNYSMVYKPITELFNIERGSGKYTKTYTKKTFR